MDTLWEIRPCCQDTGPGTFTFSNPAGEAPSCGAGAVIETKPMQRHRDRGTCFHEAGHAIVHIAIGFPTEKVTVDGQPSFHPGKADGHGMTKPQSIALSLAGPIAERWAGRHEYRLTDADWTIYVRRMRELRSGGACDLCRAALQAICHLRPSAPEADMIRLLRDVEAQTTRLIQYRPVWLAISELAAELGYHGTVAGPDTEAIARKHFDPGDFDIAATLVRKTTHEPFPDPET